MATDKHIVLITGGNTGIGYETIKALYASPTAYTILMGSRSLDKAKAAISTLESEIKSSKSEIVPIQIDIADDTSITNAFQEVEQKYGRVDSLINNAGHAIDPNKAGIRAAFDGCYTTNVTSTQLFTTTFAPLLLASTTPTPRLLFITSGLSSLTTCAAGQNSMAISSSVPKGWPKPAQMSQIAYRSSKVALNMVTLDWARLLEPDGVKVFAIAPGFLATGLAGVGADVLRKFGAGEPHVGGELIRDVVEGKRDKDAGTIVSKDGVQPW